MIQNLLRKGTISPSILKVLLIVSCFAALPVTASWAQDDTLTVTVEPKTEQHYFFNEGFSDGFVVDGEQGKVLTLLRGDTYAFQLQDVSSVHGFYLTTSREGLGAEPLTESVTGDEMLTFTPDESTPDTIYYNCTTHAFMGAPVNVMNPVEAGLSLVAEDLTHPVALAEAPDDTGRLFIVDQTGQIFILTPDGTLVSEPFLNIQDRIVELDETYDERGLLGLAFHPNYAENGRFLIYYSAPLREEAPDDWNNTSHVSEFAVSSDDPNKADPESEQILLRVDQPQSNHAGGTVAFGPTDGFLYISLGDGGGAHDTGVGHVSDWYDDNEGGNGQDVTQNLLGSILRIDVDNPEGELPYGIPDDNPFVGEEGLDEQFAYGFRNPFRFSFDIGGDNMLLVGDAGQTLWEEVSVVTNGGNYGWNVKEGTHCFDADNPETPAADCPETDAEGDRLVDPVIEFANSAQEDGLGQVVVGGYVYRGTDVPSLEGMYFFGVWGQEPFANPGPGRIFVAEPRSDGMWPFQEVQLAERDSLGHLLLSFGQDLDGEVYVLTTDEAGPVGNTGKVFKVVAPEAVARERGPAVPETFTLEQNYPNPFNPVTHIRFRLSEAADVSLVVYDATGREVKRLAEGMRTPGAYSVTWDGTDQAGRNVASGIYFYRLEAGRAGVTRGMTLMK